ncbi:hypothetical protein [Blastococcus brunescens]|uniref:ATP-grasp domain-containing protein n=1 Tax=Blastococcus brunescens TaxID=1564165 RepID=A0ABZ1BA81_9ACTN|nr:hypothetical protein [Blastococcus sp. BMG 8361]WRL66706.1 hypothetical protein U6N30_15735 [Blastococcus sp. BMG 8361]
MVKPSVSAGSRDTARWADPSAALAHAAELIAAGRTAMLQPYLASVDEAGRPRCCSSAVGSPTPSARARCSGRGGRAAGPGQPGDLRRVQPTVAQRELAGSVFSSIATLVPGAATPLYARIDLVDDAAGRPVVLELELTEPSLFLPQAPEAAGSLVRAVEAELQR